MKRRLWHPLAIGLCLAGMISAASADVPALKIAQVGKAPVIDGDLSDATWQQAAKIELDRVLYGAKPPSVKTTAWLGYDDDWLYIAVHCEDEKGREIRADYHGRNNKENDYRHLTHRRRRPTMRSVHNP